LYASPNIISVIKSRRKVLLGHVAFTGDHMGDIHTDERIILKWIFKRNGM
jgi:hypothetical protein